MSQETDDFLAHYGVKGMKWGVTKRSGGLKERVKGAELDSIHNQRTMIKRNMAGRGTLSEKIITAPDKLLFGKEFHQRYLQANLNELDAREARVKAGKRNFMDKVDLLQEISVVDLMYSQRDLRE